MSALPLPVELPVDLPLVDPVLGTATDALPELPVVSLTVGNDTSAAGVTLNGTDLTAGGGVSLA